MVRRDPRTGKFVSSGSGADWSDKTRVGGIVNYSIPAADLGGGTVTAGVDGEESEIVDFTDKLENDEVYQAERVQIATFLGLPTTATAESSAIVKFELGSRGDPTFPATATPVFYGGVTSAEDGIVDVNSTDEEAGSVFWMGQHYAEASAVDTVNALGAGADAENDKETVYFGSAGPVFDRDDELYAPAEISVDNVSDHAVVASCWVLLDGEVQELD